MRWSCNFHFRYVTDEILFTLQVYFAKSRCSFLDIFRIFSQKKWIVELCYWSEFRDRKENEIFAS